MFSSGPPRPREEASKEESEAKSVSGVGRPAGWSMDAGSRRTGAGLFGQTQGHGPTAPDAATLPGEESLLQSTLGKDLHL